MQTNDRDPDPTLVEVSHALERVITWLRDSRAPGGLSASTLSALSRLETGGPLRVTELSYREGLTQPGMTTLIHRLEDAGLAIREPDPSDGRAVRVSITSLGIEHVTAYRAARAGLIGERLGILGDDDRNAMIAALPALDHLIAEPAAAVSARASSTTIPQTDTKQTVTNPRKSTTS